MTHASKRKGSRVELRIVQFLEKLGIKAGKQPLSGALQDYPHDAWADIPGRGRTSIEVKARKGGEGFKQLDRWRGKADMLLLVQDRCEPMVYVPLSFIGDLTSAIKELEATTDAARRAGA